MASATYITSSYGTYIKADTYEPFRLTTDICTKAVRFFLTVFSKEWDYMNTVYDHVTSKEAVRFMESISHRTIKRPVVAYDFDSKFYKMPSGIRRFCICKAFGLMSSYKSNLSNWMKSKNGKKPKFPKVSRVMPVFYKSENQSVDDYHVKIKVYNGSDWVWLTVTQRKSDVDYLKRHFSNIKAYSPCLEKHHKKYFLRYAFKEEAHLKKTNEKILAVDLGINSAAACSVMLSDGTVLGRRFLKLSKEEDRMKHELNKMKKAQTSGSVRMPRKWARISGLNKDIAVRTARFIMETAMDYGVDVIVFEHLDLGKKKRGSKKQRLHLWKARYVQNMVTDKAHREGIHVSHVNAWKTSRLAFDGSGEVERGKYMVGNEEKYNYSICIFQSGKQYNCDLNATYNIGARYFIRETLKSLSETVRSDILAKVPECQFRSRCVLASLIKLNAVLIAGNCK